MYEAAAASGPPSSNHSIRAPVTAPSPRANINPSSVASQPDRPAPARFSSPGPRVPVAEALLPPPAGFRPPADGARGVVERGLEAGREVFDAMPQKLTGATPAQLAHRHQKGLL